jgi:branched-chain amino acid transport system permease protein
MNEWLSFTIVGLVTGCVYALIATGLVVTYTTTGIFNFAHGAIGMIAAFTFWQLWQGWHVNAIVSLLLVLVVIAPAFGVVVERVLMRPLYGASVDMTVVVTLGLLLALVGIAQQLWKSTTHILPPFFNGNGFRVSGVLVSYHELIALIATIVIAVGLYLLFNRTRIGVAMRAVVDSPDLLAMAGGRPDRVQQLSWALGCALAALAGILLAPIRQLDIILLTLLVVDGYAAAVIGRLRNLPVALIGALLIGLGQEYALGYAPGSGFLSQIQNVIPMFVLFAVLILLPQDRLRTASFAGTVAPRVASLRSSVAGGVALFVAALVVAQFLSAPNLRIGANGFALALILLSLVLLTGYGGMVSLCQMSFVGLGATAMGHWGGHGHSLLGVLAAIGLAAGVGAVVALPTLKMRGLYLALATFAFATVMQQAVFTQVLGTGGSLAIPRPYVPGFSSDSDRVYFMLCVAVFILAAIALLAMRRGPFGRRLVAMNDSPAACATLGVNVNWTKLVAFTVSAGLAGLGGVLLSGVPESASTNDFAALVSLVALLLARVGGINTATGAVLGAFVFAIFPVLQQHFPSLGNLQFLLTGLAAISVGRDPNGIGGRISAIADRFRRPADTSAPDVPTRATGAAAVFLDEEASLVGSN